MSKVCPFLASGWIANKYAAMTEYEETWKTEHLPKCLEGDCMAWENGQCALIPRRSTSS